MQSEEHAKLNRNITDACSYLGIWLSLIAVIVFYRWFKGPAYVSDVEFGNAMYYSFAALLGHFIVTRITRKV